MKHFTARTHGKLDRYLINSLSRLPGGDLRACHLSRLLHAISPMPYIASAHAPIVAMQTLDSVSLFLAVSHAPNLLIYLNLCTIPAFLQDA